MAVHDFTLSHPKAEDRTFGPDAIFGIIRDRGPRIGIDYIRTQSFVQAKTLLEMAEEGDCDAADDLVAHLRHLAEIDVKDPGLYQNVTLTAYIDAAAPDGDGVDDEVVRALLQPHGISLANPPRGAEASWMHSAYAGIGRIPLRYQGLPTGLPGILVRRDERKPQDDHISITWDDLHYLRMGDRRILNIMTGIPEIMITELIGTPLDRLVAVPGLSHAVIDEIIVGDDGRYVEVGVTI